MLVDPDFIRPNQYAFGGNPGHIRLGAGMYLIEDFSFDFRISKTGGNLPIAADLDDWMGWPKDLGRGLSSGGVCDSPEQFMTAVGGALLDSPRKFCVSFTRIVKSEQDSSGGWRWHKWGEYIGTKSPKHEYLYDEDDSITEVYCYQVYERVS